MAKVTCGAFFLLAILQIGSQQRHTVYLRGVRCNASEKYIHSNLTCFAKSYSRTFSGLNLYYTLKVPLYEIYVSVSNFGDK